MFFCTKCSYGFFIGGVRRMSFQENDFRNLMYDLIKLIYDNMERIQETRYEFEVKADGSPVTPSDILIEKLIYQLVNDRISEVTFIGEENFFETDSYNFDGFIAILDPIDGTENFCSGLKEWGISFTLWNGKTHIGSLLFLPELGEYLMTGDNFNPVRSRIRGFSSSMCDEILEGMRSTQESRLMGCAVYNLYNVVRGAFARFTNPRGAYSWDLLPGLMLAREHNCDIEVEGKPYNGEFLEPGKKYRVDIRHRYDFHTR